MNKITLTYRVALICFFLQFALLALGTFDRDDIELTGNMVLSGIVLVLIKGIPWLVLVPGLIMRHEKTMAWMSYVCLVYFIIWILAAFGTGQTGIAQLGVLLTVLQFTAAAMYTRFIKRQAA